MSLLKSGSIKVAFGFGLGVMAAEAVKQVLPALRDAGRPVLKAAVKSGMILARDGKARFAEFRETLADLRSEAEAELEQTAPQMPLKQPFATRDEHSAEIM